MQAYYPEKAQNLYHPDFYNALVDGSLAVTYPGLAAILRKNSTGLVRHGIDMLILQGTNDVVVFPDTQRVFVDGARSRGENVELKIFEGARHDTRQIGFEYVQSWITQRLRNPFF